MRIAIVDESELRSAVLEAGLREAGHSEIFRISPKGPFVAELETLKPDVVIIDLGNPSRDTLEEMLTVSRALARPTAMFVDQSDDDMIEAAIEAGVSAYVVDGLRKDRVKPIIDVAIKRFNAFTRLQAELHEARNALVERKTVDRAKAVLMSSRGIGEPEAYALLRSTAMNQGRRIVEVADALLTANALLKGDGK